MELEKIAEKPTVPTRFWVRGRAAAQLAMAGFDRNTKNTAAMMHSDAQK